MEWWVPTEKQVKCHIALGCDVVYGIGPSPYEKPDTTKSTMFMGMNAPIKFLEELPPFPNQRWGSFVASLGDGTTYHHGFPHEWQMEFVEVYNSRVGMLYDTIFHITFPPHPTPHPMSPHHHHPIKAPHHQCSTMLYISHFSIVFHSSPHFSLV